MRKETGAASAGLWAALGCERERGRKADWALCWGKPGRMGHAGVEKGKRLARLGFQLSFGPQPK
jgi:hypothetical protein